MHFNACYSGQTRKASMPPAQASHTDVSLSKPEGDVRGRSRTKLLDRAGQGH